MCDNCRPLGFLIGLPFMLVAFLLSLIGVLLWIITVPFMFCCPCILCFTLLAEFAVSLIKAPFNVITWFTEQIPC